MLYTMKEACHTGDIMISDTMVQYQNQRRETSSVSLDPTSTNEGSNTMANPAI